MNEQPEQRERMDSAGPAPAPVLQYYSARDEEPSNQNTLATAITVLLFIFVGHLLTLMLGTSLRGVNGPGYTIKFFAGGLLIPLAHLIPAALALLLRQSPANRPYAIGIWIGLAIAVVLQAFFFVSMVAR